MSTHVYGVCAAPGKVAHHRYLSITKVCWFAGLLACWFAGLLVCWEGPDSAICFPRFLAGSIRVGNFPNQPQQNLKASHYAAPSSPRRPVPTLSQEPRFSLMSSKKGDILIASGMSAYSQRHNRRTDSHGRKCSGELGFSSLQIRHAALRSPRKTGTLPIGFADETKSEERIHPLLRGTCCRLAKGRGCSDYRQSPFAFCQPSTSDRWADRQAPEPSAPQPKIDASPTGVGGLLILQFCAVSPGNQPPESQNGVQRSFRPRRVPGTKRDPLRHVPILLQSASGSGPGPC